MVGRRLRGAITVAGAVLAIVVALLAAPASAAASEGTFTKITMPTHDLLFHFVEPGTNHLRVAGTTSLDVTQVDLVCIIGTSAERNVSNLLPGVPVTSGVFDVIVTLTDYTAPCRMRAVPTGVDPLTAYLASYSGPVLRMATVQLQKSGGVTVGYLAATAAGTGLALTSDGGECSQAAMLTIETPSMEVRGGGLREACALTLPTEDVAHTGNSITVDGHNAYLPIGVAHYLRDNLGLTVPRSTLSVTSHLSSNGDLHVTEAGKLRRCTGTAPDTDPPTVTSCTGLTDTGVTFHRVVDLFRGSHQVRIRDSFVGTDTHAHSVHLKYFSGFEPEPTGTTGYLVPNHGTSFRKVSVGQTFTGLGTRANTLYVRSDLYAASDEQDADTLGYTWSRAPSSVKISPVSTAVFELPYSLNVPAHGRADVGFAWSERVATKDTRALALVAQREMINAPHVSSPHGGAVISGHRTTVKGYVTLGANGLPTAVTVNGHGARLTRVSSTKATYAVTFRESLGRHVLTVTARDVAGNTKSVGLRVKNV